MNPSATLSPHIISFAAVNWDFPLIGRTRMLTEAWLRVGQPTTFIEPPHSYRSYLSRLIGGGERTPPVVIRPRPTRYPVRWWTRMSPARLRKMMREGGAALRRRLERRLRPSEAVATVVTPIWMPWVEAAGFGGVIYDCIDDLAVHAPDPAMRRILISWERELVGRCAGAVVTAETLAEGLRAIDSRLRIEMIRNGVDADAFRERSLKSTRPADLPSKSKTIIGFVGALYEWIDFDLIAHAARALPDVEFVFIGPSNDDSAVERISRLSNICFLGPRPYESVPAYVAAFDTCWVPFKAGDITAAANPVKIYEYLALGKPVITTAVADPASFNGLVGVGRTPEEIVSLLQSSLASEAKDAETRVQFARENSWDARAAQYSRFARESLGR